MTPTQVETCFNEAIEEAAGLNPAAVSWLQTVKARIANEWMEEAERECADQLWAEAREAIAEAERIR